MKKLILAVLLASVSASVFAGNCTYPDDIAADGSICGGRAASVRPGGEVPPPEYSAPVPAPKPIKTVMFVTTAKCDNGYEFGENSIYNRETGAMIKDMAAITKSGKVVTLGQPTEATTINPDGVTSTDDLIIHDETGYYTLAYNYKDAMHINNEKGAIIFNKKLLAHCSITIVSN